MTKKFYDGEATEGGGVTKPLTKEEILDEQYATGMHWKTVNRANVLIGMEAYASQRSSSLQKRIEVLTTENGLADIKINQLHGLLNSCENALADRDKKVEVLERENAELKKSVIDRSRCY